MFTSGCTVLRFLCLFVSLLLLMWKGRASGRDWAKILCGKSNLSETAKYKITAKSFLLIKSDIFRHYTFMGRKGNYWLHLLVITITGTHCRYRCRNLLFKIYEIVFGWAELKHPKNKRKLIRAKMRKAKLIFKMKSYNRKHITEFLVLIDFLSSLLSLTI